MVADRKGKALFFPIQDATPVSFYYDEPSHYQAHKRVFAYTQRKCIKEIHDLVSVDTFCGGESLIITLSVNHSENVEPFTFLRWNAHILPRQLPAVRYISYGQTICKYNKCPL